MPFLSSIVPKLLSATAAVFLFCLALMPPVVAGQDFEQNVASLYKASFSKKAKIAAQLAEQDPLRARVVLEALIAGDLYFVRSAKRIVRAEDRSKPGIDVLNGETVTAKNKRDLKKIRSNNKLRKELRNLIAGLSLKDPDPATRLAAAEELLGNNSDSVFELLTAALEQEKVPKVREAMQLGMATVRAEHPDVDIRREAIETLSRSLQPQALTALRSIVSNESEEQALRDLAQSAIDEIESKLTRFAVLENLFFGISLGSVLLLAAIGLAVTFGVMGVINMAHGEMVMLGAYTTFVVQTLMPSAIDYSLFVALPAAFLVTALVGILIERGVIRHLYGRPLETLLATFGISLILQQAVRSIFSPLNRAVSSPSWMSGALEVNPALALTYNRLYIILFALLVLVGLALALKYSRFGLEMRAVTQNRDMARAMGIRTGRVDALTFGLGSGVAGLAGVALSQLTNVGPNMGQAYIVDSFMVVVFGGVGNLLGTFVGAMSLGIANKLLEPAAGAVLAKILILVMIILFIQRRPQGLFALKGRRLD